MTVKKNDQSGFVMVEVLVTVMLVIFFTVFLFSSVTRRHRMAVNAASKTEARLAAEAAVQVLAVKISEEESSEILEKLTSSGGLPETEAVVWADNGNGEEKRIEAVVSSSWKADGSGLVLHAVCTVNGQEESASLLLGKKKFFVYTPSSAERREDREEV